MDLVQVKRARDFVQTARYENGAGEVQIPPGYGLYELKTGCANLGDDNRCSIYPFRPGCCRDFSVGSPACLEARRKAGLDGGVVVEAPDPNRELISEFFSTPAEEHGASAPASGAAGPNLDEIRSVIARDSAWIMQRLRGLDAQAWASPTRCPPWDVGVLTAHLVTGQQQAAAILSAALGGTVATTPPEFVRDPATTLRAFSQAASNVSLALERVTRELLDRDVILDNVAAVQVGHVVEMTAIELAIHGLDLAAALGDDRHLDDEEMRVIARALPEILEPGIPPRPKTSYLLRSEVFEVALTWRKEAWRRELGAKACRIEGDPEELLLFATGRTQFAESNLSTNSPDRAGAFKRHLAGP